MKFRILEGVTIADIAFEAYGKTLEELFANAALALSEVMVNTMTVGRIKNYELRIKNKEVEELLFDFLSEIVFLKDSRNLLFSQYQVEIRQKPSQYFLEAILDGEEIDRNKHHLKVDVKGVTKHQFLLRKEKRRYVCKIVVDV